MIGKKQCLIMCLVLMSLHSSVKAQDDKYAAPDRFELSQQIGSIPEPQTGPEGFDASAGPNIKLKGGEVGIEYFALSPERIASEITKPKQDQYIVSYPIVPEGCMVRILDGVYRLKFEKRWSLVRVGNEDVPKKMIITKETYVFGIGKGGGLHGKQLIVGDRVRVAKDGENELEMHVSGEKLLSRKRQFYRSGAMFWIGKYGHRVKSVVLPDSDNKYLGYVEIASVPEIVNEAGE